VVQFLEHGPAWSEVPYHSLVEDETEQNASFVQQLAKRGWVVPAWPREYGGAGLTVLQQFIFNEEMGYRHAPRARGVGPQTAGPAIMLFGTPEQKRRHLPGITGAREVWCQGFSEHGAGSDLASLQCRAVLDGDDWVVNGTKMWTSYSHFADWMLLLVRTDPPAPKHRGITCLLLDMKRPGITLHPYLTMMNNHHFNEVELNDVRVPVSCTLGEANKGWYVATAALDYERSNVGRMASYRRDLERLADWILQHRPAHEGERTHARLALAELFIELEVGTALSYRVAAMQNAGLVPNMEASMCKVFSTEFGSRLYNTGLGLLGLSGQLMADTPSAPLRGAVERAYLWSVVNNIAAGSSEIQRNVIATRGLRLPR